MKYKNFGNDFKFFINHDFLNTIKIEHIKKYFKALSTYKRLTMNAYYEQCVTQSILPEPLLKDKVFRNLLPFSTNVNPFEFFTQMADSEFFGFRESEDNFRELHTLIYDKVEKKEPLSLFDICRTKIRKQVFEMNKDATNGGDLIRQLQLPTLILNQLMYKSINYKKISHMYLD